MSAKPEHPEPGISERDALVAPLRRPGRGPTAVVTPAAVPVSAVADPAVDERVAAELAAWKSHARGPRSRWLAPLAMVAVLAGVAGAITLAAPGRHGTATTAHHPPVTPAVSVPTPAVPPITRAPVSATPALTQRLVHVPAARTLLLLTVSSPTGPPKVDVIDPDGRLYSSLRSRPDLRHTTQPRFNVTELAILRPRAGAWRVMARGPVQITVKLTKAKFTRPPAEHAASPPHALPPAPASTPSPTPQPAYTPPPAPLQVAPNPTPAAPRRTPCVPGTLGC